MSSQPHSSGRRVFVSFVIAITCFVGAMLVAQLQNRGIRRAARSIIDNSSPSLVSLAQMRAIVNRLEVSVDDDVGNVFAGGVADSRAQVALADGALERLWRSYERLPSYVGEDAMWPDVEARLARVDTTVAQTYEALDSHDFEAAERALDRGLKPAVLELDQSLAELVSFNAQQGVFEAERIESLNRRSLLTGLLAGGSGVALAAVAGWWAYLFVRRNEAWGDRRIADLELFAGQVAHDIVGPLSGVGLTFQLIERQSADPRVHASIQRGIGCVRRCDRIIHDLLDFARAGAPAVAGARVDLATVVREVVDDVAAVAAQSSVDVIAEPFEAVEVACSAGLATSVLENLVRNAIKYMSTSPVRKVTVRVRPGERVKVEVEDTGPGLPQALSTAVFEPFVRGGGTKQPGIGLGLATVKRLVVAHGGRVGVERSPSGGCMFWFELPRAGALGQSAEPPGLKGLLTRMLHPSRQARAATR